MKELYISFISNELNIKSNQILSTIKLLNESNTVPFISRYRKEMTGNLTEVDIFEIEKFLKKFTELENRKITIINSIKEQDKLTPELEKEINETISPIALEDIYLPYKPKRKTKATIAKSLGLEPLAHEILKQTNNNPLNIATKFLTNEVINEDFALQGARDIIAEIVSEDSRIREQVRNLFLRAADIQTKVVKAKAEDDSKYRDYFDFNEPINKCKPHRLMAILRALNEGVIRLSVKPDEEEATGIILRKYIKSKNLCSQQVEIAINDSYKRLICPSIENDTINHYKAIADKEAIKVFASNLRQLLMLPPLGPRRILAIDPGFRTGCKIVCLDEQGNLIHNQTIYPHPPNDDKAMAGKKILSTIEMYKINTIAIGNGTASRETEYFIKSLRFKKDIDVYMVDESGASVYSASTIARKEFPDYDVTVRGAVSIGRRLIDPLAELIKIDPCSIGVGQYQHDIDENRLKEELDNVVISVVNNVGVNVNTASDKLLTYVSGLGQKTAEKLVLHRKTKGTFNKREEILEVQGIGTKAYEQCAGFLKIPNSINPLDNTAIHPEKYNLINKMAKSINTNITNLLGNEKLINQINIEKFIDQHTGIQTLNDIINELKKPGIDPRGKVKSFSFDETIRSINDLKEGMIIPGIVSNITNFGVFVDIGLKQSGLIHISELADRFVANPTEVVNVHQHLFVKVISVDIDRKRIQLSLKNIDDDVKVKGER